MLRFNKTSQVALSYTKFNEYFMNASMNEMNDFYDN